MKRIIFAQLVFTSVIIFFSACERAGNCEPESYQYSFFKSKSLDTTMFLNPPDNEYRYYQFSVNPGNNIVFKYTKNFRDCPEIMDDEGMESIYFEVDQSVSSFLLDDSTEIAAAKALVFKTCECTPYLPVAISHGTIEGTRVSNNSWRIKANLKMPGGNNSFVQFDKVFEIQ